MILEGPESPSGTYGAVVHVYAGNKHQVRTKNAGEHYRSQNDDRIYFGLAQNSVVDSLMVYWISGIIQKLYNIIENQILTLIEQSCTINTSQAEIASKGWIVFPNPTSQFFQITTSRNDIYKIEALNSLGHLISAFEFGILYSNSERNFSIDRAGLFTPKALGSSKTQV